MTGKGRRFLFLILLSRMIATVIIIFLSSYKDGESIYLIYVVCDDENMPACTLTTLSLLMGLKYKE
jgi:hypothetical protein